MTREYERALVMKAPPAHTIRRGISGEAPALAVISEALNGYDRRSIQE